MAEPENMDWLCKIDSDTAIYWIVITVTVTVIMTWKVSQGVLLMVELFL